MPILKVKRPNTARLERQIKKIKKFGRTDRIHLEKEIVFVKALPLLHDWKQEFIVQGIISWTPKNTSDWKPNQETYDEV